MTYELTGNHAYNINCMELLREVPDKYFDLKRLIEVFTDPGDVVIDPCAGSGTTLRAAYELGRASYGFEIDRDMCKKAKEQILGCMKPDEQEEQTTLFA